MCNVMCNVCIVLDPFGKNITYLLVPVITSCLSSAKLVCIASFDPLSSARLVSLDPLSSARLVCIASFDPLSSVIFS